MASGGLQGVASRLGLPGLFRSSGCSGSGSRDFLESPLNPKP